MGFRDEDVGKPRSTQIMNNKPLLRIPIPCDKETKDLTIMPDVNMEALHSSIPLIKTVKEKPHTVPAAIFSKGLRCFLKALRAFSYADHSSSKANPAS